MNTNPSHILIARNSRGQNTPSATLSSPTETHAAASGIFRFAGPPQWMFEECDTEEASILTAEESSEDIEVHETFARDAKFPGTVKIVVESTTFWSVGSLTIYLSVIPNGVLHIPCLV